MTPRCFSCGSGTEKVIVTPPTGFVTGKFEAFVSMVDGTLVRNQKELEEHNKRNGVVNLQDGYSEEKVLNAEFGQQGIEGPDKKDIAKDVQEAINMVSSGYKPTIGAEDE